MKTLTLSLSLSILSLLFLFSCSSSSKIAKTYTPLTYRLVSASDVTAADILMAGKDEITDLKFDKSKKIIEAADNKSIPVAFKASMNIRNDNKFAVDINTFTYQIISANNVIEELKCEDKITVPAGGLVTHDFLVEYDAYKMVGKGFDEYSIIKFLFGMENRIMEQKISFRVKPMLFVKDKNIQTAYSDVTVKRF